MYLIHDEVTFETFETSERFIETLKNEIYKYIISISKNVYIDKLDDIMNKYNNTYHRTIKTRPVDVKPSIYKKILKKVLNLKLVIIFKYQIIKISLQKAMFQIGLEKVFVIKNVRKT